LLGGWNLYVTAFLDGNEEDEYLKAARGNLGDIEVIPEETITGDVVLFPITEGQGTFRWDISFPDNVVTARMEIMRLGGIPYKTFYFVGGDPLIDSSYSHKLDAGQYHVIFTLYNDRGERATVSAILHIYQNMGSPFADIFNDDHFPISLAGLILNAWDGSSWDFALHGITARHFYLLGIDGINDDNFDRITHWFNIFGSLSQVPTDKTGLKSLVGTVLVHMGEMSVPGDTFVAKLGWIRTYALDGGSYLVEINTDEEIGPQSQLVPASQSGITITLRGMEIERIINLSENGSLFAVGSGVSLVLDENVTLQGRTDNNAPLVRVNNGGTLVMNAGASVMGNTNTPHDMDDFGGGVLVNTGSMFTMNGGEIFGNVSLYTSTVVLYGRGGGGVCCQGRCV